VIALSLRSVPPASREEIDFLQAIGNSPSDGDQVSYTKHERSTRMTRIYVTHCSSKKDDRYKGTGVAVTPDLLYTGRAKGFMKRCKEKGVCWAIFSDKYGVWFPDARREWYDKHPSEVTPAEFATLLRDFDEGLADYSEIYFYANHNNARRFPPSGLYARLLNQTALRDRIKRITHFDEIT